MGFTGLSVKTLLAYRAWGSNLEMLQTSHPPVLLAWQCKKIAIIHTGYASTKFSKQLCVYNIR